MVDLKTIVRMAFIIPALCVFLISCGQQDSLSEGSLPRQETLYLSGQQWGSPATFNPLAESWMAAWPVGGRFNLMYEPLITYNTLNGEFEPLLGNLIDSLSNNDSIVVDLNPAAMWSDGKKVTSKDVKFIFELGFHYAGAVTSFVTEQITAINVDTVYTLDPVSFEKVMLNERLSFIVAKKKRNNPLHTQLRDCN